MKKVLCLDLKYTAGQVFYYATFCATMSYASVFLLDRGFNNSEIGAVLSIVSMIAVFSQPMLASFADDHIEIPINKMVCYVMLIVIALSAIVYFLSILEVVLLIMVVSIFS